MNLNNLSARRNRDALLEQPADSSFEKKTRTLQDLSRDELLREALYATPGAPTPDLEELDADRLREEVRWRRAAIIREPAFSTLATLLAEVSPEESLETLVKGEISPEQLLEKAKTFAADYRDKKLLEPPDVRDLERRLMRLEAAVCA